MFHNLFLPESKIDKIKILRFLRKEEVEDLKAGKRHEEDNAMNKYMSPSVNMKKTTQ